MLQPTGDLLRRPQRLEFARHDLHQGSVLRQLADFGAVRPIPSGLVSLGCPVALLPTIASDLAADGRCRSPKTRCYRANRLIRNHGTGDFFTLLQGQCQTGSATHGGTYPTRGSKDATHRGVLAVKQPGNLV